MRVCWRCKLTEDQPRVWLCPHTHCLRRELEKGPKVGAEILPEGYSRPEEIDNEPRCNCGHLFEICNYPNCPCGGDK